MTVAPDGTFSYALDPNHTYHHANASDPNELKTGAEAFTVNVTDTYGNTSTVTVSVNIYDDGPTLNISNGVFQNAPGSLIEGTLAHIGADWDGAHVDLSGNSGAVTATIDGVSQPLTSFGVPVTYAVDPLDHSILYGKAGTSTVFTITGHADGTYTFSQQALLDLSVLTVSTTGSVDAGGPQPPTTCAKTGCSAPAPLPLGHPHHLAGRRRQPQHPGHGRCEQPVPDRGTYALRVRQRRRERHRQLRLPVLRGRQRPGNHGRRAVDGGTDTVSDFHLDQDT